MGAVAVPYFRGAVTGSRPPFAYSLAVMQLCIRRPCPPLLQHLEAFVLAASPVRSLARLLAACAFLFLAAQLGGAEDLPGPLSLDRPLVAYWDFDEPFGVSCTDLSGSGAHAEPGRPGGLERVEGVFGNAMSFSGGHLLQVAAQPAFSNLSALSLSAWVLPTDLSEYREIFRKDDGDQRILFSFQGDGTILSLGLNIGGYVECDAPIDPSRVLDGQWHHCAASFDGETMRVYLDGEQVGSLERPGSIVSGGLAPACIGSSGGSENFQGLMDELRLYSAALTAEQIVALHENGRAALRRVADNSATGEPAVDRPLLGHWSFNEPGVGAAIQDASGRPELQIVSGSAPVRARGVHGRALRLSGAHSLRTAGGLGTGELAGIGFSAWVLPTELGGNREIFRKEDGDRRLLFSFQGDGAILSLGLNIGGYVECDAPIDPGLVLDGRWHHCAATFDGRWMRVYLDGAEIGSLERPGTVVTDTNSSGFIGSSTGQSEHFQGLLDDLRVYSAALSPEEAAAICAAGQETLAAFDESLAQRLETFYREEDTFAETLAGSRERLVKGGHRIDLDLAGVLVRRLRGAFSQDYANFTEWVGASPVEYLAARDESFQASQAGRLVDLLMEYAPLTEEQRAGQTPEEAEKWRECAALQRLYEDLMARGEEAAFSPEWIDLMLQAGGRIDFRPRVHEPVAPYVKPSTPQTRSFSRAEAREALERDWLHQADHNPSPERIAAEIGWALELAGRIEARSKSGLLRERRELLRLRQRARGLTAPDAELYFAVREVKRRIVFADPVVDFRGVLFVDMPYPQGSEWPHETRHRLGYMSVPGARLLVLEGLSPEGRLRQLMPKAPLHGAFWRPDLSFDARKVLFCFRPHNEKSFHLYEINLDGTGLHQLTDGPYDDLDPIYLPDGHLMFSTTRAHTYVRCMPPTNAFVLARCDSDGRNVYLISTNNEPDYLPSVMPDGRVIYTRWEYTDKPLWRAQGLWTVAPDGTRVGTLWGNQSVWPDLLKDARCIPNSSRIMFTGSAHHNWFAGSVGIIDPSLGFNFPRGLSKVTADVIWPESGNGPIDPIECEDYHTSGSYSGYYSPYPLSEEVFLVSACRGGKFVLYVMDTHGNRELIYEGEHNILHALPIRPRPVPPILPSSVKWPTFESRDRPEDGVLFSSDVYQGAPAALKDNARYLRIMSIDAKTYTYWYKRPYISTGPVVSMVQSEGVKRIIGTVPIAADGSVAFKAPAGKSLHFQLLDGEQRALQTMRSFANIMPGESRGCVGCHELHSTAPPVKSPQETLISGARDITPPPWKDTTVSFERYVQPVLDRHCGRCHQGSGKAREVLDLTRRPGYAMFDEPYVTLTGRPTWAEPYSRPDPPPPGFGIAAPIMVEGYSTVDPAAYVTPEPMAALSYGSRLVDIASSGEHHGVKVDEESRLRLITWIDAMCPYLGDDEIRKIPDPQFQGIDWLAIRPRIATAPRIVRPGPVDGRR